MCRNPLIIDKNDLNASSGSSTLGTHTNIARATWNDHHLENPALLATPFSIRCEHEARDVAPVASHIAIIKPRTPLPPSSKLFDPANHFPDLNKADPRSGLGLNELLELDPLLRGVWVGQYDLVPAILMRQMLAELILIVFIKLHTGEVRQSKPPDLVLATIWASLFKLL